MRNVTFSENTLHDNVFIKNSSNFASFSVSCIRNNKKGSQNINGGGTCFVFRYVDYIYFESVVVSDSYNDYTTVAVKLIESEVIIYIYFYNFSDFNIFLRFS